MDKRINIIIGLSSNQSPQENVEAGIRSLRRLFPNLRVSALRRTAPLQGRGPDYINAVATAETTLPASAIVLALKCMEQTAGRLSDKRHPVCLDLDLMDYGGQFIQEYRLPRTAQLALDFNQEALAELIS